MGGLTLQKRRLGKSCIEVSTIGLGTVKFGRNQNVKYPYPFSLPSDYEIENLLDYAKALGINLLDTAPAYGTSEERLGKLLHGKRQEWIISTKVGEAFFEGKSYFDFSANTIRESIERSLLHLKTDYIDIALVHSNGDDQRIIEEEHIFSLLAALKKEGKIRAYGMSTKTVAGGLLAVDMADVVMVAYNPSYTEEREVINYAYQHQKGIFIKKAFASGHLPWQSSDPIAESIRFILQEPGISSVIVGTLNPSHLQHNVKCVDNLV